MIVMHRDNNQSILGHLAHLTDFAHALAESAIFCGAAGRGAAGHGAARQKNHHEIENIMTDFITHVLAGIGLFYVAVWFYHLGRKTY